MNFQVRLSLHFVLLGFSRGEQCTGCSVIFEPYRHIYKHICVFLHIFTSCVMCSGEWNTWEQLSLKEPSFPASLTIVFFWRFTSKYSWGKNISKSSFVFSVFRQRHGWVFYEMKNNVKMLDFSTFVKIQGHLNYWCQLFRQESEKVRSWFLSTCLKLWCKETLVSLVMAVVFSYLVL